MLQHLGLLRRRPQQQERAPDVPGREGMAGSAALAAELERLCAHLTASPPATPSGAVLPPGEIERRTRAERVARGIPLDPNTLHQLRAAARAVGLSEAEIEQGITSVQSRA